MDSDIDGLLEDQATLKQKYDSAFSELSGASQEYDDDLKVYYDDVHTATLLHLNPDFNLVSMQRLTVYLKALMLEM